MEATNEMDERQIQAESASLGMPKRVDPNAPKADMPVAPQMLDNRQEAFGERRRYAGPKSNKDPEKSSERSVRSEMANRSYMPPTPCAEPMEE